MAPVKITLNKAVIDEIDLTPLNKYVEWNKNNFQYFNLEAGKEHYKICAYLSKTLTCKKIIDLGTYMGFSATALSFDDTKQVLSYDIFNWLSDDGSITAESKENITLFIGDYISDLPEIVKDSDLVMIDIDHTGATEIEIMDILRKCNYKGLVLIDDIGLNDEMKKFWDEIPEKKLDISKYAHWSLSGLVIFDPTRFEIILE